MRTRIAFRRAAKGDPEARAAVVRAYSYVADPESVAAALSEFDGGGVGAFVAHVRWLLEHPPTVEPLATARVDGGQFMGATAGAPPPRKPRAAAGQEAPEAEPEVAEEALAADPQADLPPDPEDSGIPPTTEEVPPAPEVSIPAGTPPTPPATGNGPEPKVREVRAVTRKPARIKTGTGAARSAVPSGVHQKVIGAVLSVAPKWQWSIHDCCHLEVGDAALKLFSRQDAMAIWITLDAETTGAATVAVPRPGMVQLRRVRGSGPIELSLYEDRIVARRDSEPIVAPARSGAIPAIPEIEVRAGAIVARDALAAALETEAEEVRLEYCDRRLLVGGQEVPLVYAPSCGFQAILDPKLLNTALRHGSESTMTLEVGKPTDPVIITSGCLTAAVAPRQEAYLG